MKTLEMTLATAPLRDYARGVRKEPVILTRGGKPVAALLAISGVDRETLALSTHPAFLAIIERSRAHLRSARGVPNSQMRRQLGATTKGRRSRPDSKR
ncbi:MAG: hypothetical protein RDU83_10970 [bacterium]|nr:hypothetical protein [bacterium]